MSEFPRAELTAFCELLLREGGLGERYVEGAHLICLALVRYDELSERCVTDNAKASLAIADLRQRLREFDPTYR